MNTEIKKIAFGDNLKVRFSVVRKVPYTFLHHKKRDELKGILRKLHEAKPEELDKIKKEAASYFKDTNPKELALAEQELIQEGVERQEMKRLCDVHLEVMKDNLGIKAKSTKLPASHPISILKEEHKIIKRNLKKLKRVLEKLKIAGSFDKAKPYINTLKELSHFFLETEKHHEREEEGIFPRLVAHGVTEPPEIFKEDHAEFKAKKKNLNEIVTNIENQFLRPEGRSLSEIDTEPAIGFCGGRMYKNFKEFLGLVTPIVEFLTKNLEEHIYKEDNILYPMSLETLRKAEWKDVRKKFDIIGYCCFAPADIQKTRKRKKR